MNQQNFGEKGGEQAQICADIMGKLGICDFKYEHTSYVFSSIESRLLLSFKSISRLN